MSIEEIIPELEILAMGFEQKQEQDDPKSTLWKVNRDRATALREAIALLRTHPDTQPNEPLTLEELRGMDGQPVWVEGLEGSWALVMVHGDGDVLINCANGEAYILDEGYDPNNDIDHQVVTAYRRPPKED